MAETNPSQEELLLRRRARRRLVGAIALALLAVVVLPMVFDPEPRPLGDKVEIRIPEQNEPFVPTAPAVPAGPQAKETLPPPTPVASVPTEPPVPAVSAVADAKPVEKAPVAVKTDTKPVEQKTESKPVPRAETKPAAAPKTEPKPKIEAKPVESKAEAEKPAATGGYLLQLGLFSSKANAEQQAAKAKAAGFRASIQQAGSKFRVLVGPVADRAKALDYQSKLKSKGLESILVEP